MGKLEENSEHISSVALLSPACFPLLLEANNTPDQTIITQGIICQSTGVLFQEHC